MRAVRPPREPVRNSRIRSLALTTCYVVAIAFCPDTAAADPTDLHANATPSLEAGDALGRAIFGVVMGVLFTVALVVIVVRNIRAA